MTFKRSPRRALMRSFTLKNLTVNNLCVSHNSRLSATDTEAGRLTDAIKAFHATARERELMPLRWAKRTFHVDGALIERWFMKTAISNCAGFGLPIGRISTEPHVPDETLVKMCFGTFPVTKPYGMWGAAAVGNTIREDDHFSLTYLEKADEFIAACVFEYLGFRFLVNLTDARPDEAFFNRFPQWRGTILQDSLRAVHMERINVSIVFDGA